MNIFSGLEKIVETNYPIAGHTWYGIGGPVDYFIQPDSIEQFQDVLSRCLDNNIKIYVLGAGSNLLISDKGLKGAVIKLGTGQLKTVEYGSDNTVTAWAGADLGKLVLDCVARGLSGTESLTGIPGSVGGAVRMNAGGNFGDIGSIIETVTLMDNNGKVFEKSKPELVFDYRQVNITAPFILNARMQLNQSEPDNILRSIKEIWMYKKNNQPLNTKNSGCIFKNTREVSAGALIDRAGLKGLSVGGACVSEKHANFIVASQGCKSSDITQLIDTIRQRVQEEFDIELELEIEIWN